MAEIPVPAQFVGMSLGELDIRNRYAVSVLLIKQKVAGREDLVNAVPDADYVFRPGDVMLVMGPNDRLRELERARG